MERIWGIDGKSLSIDESLIIESSIYVFIHIINNINIITIKSHNNNIIIIINKLFTFVIAWSDFTRNTDALHNTSKSFIPKSGLQKYDVIDIVARLERNVDDDDAIVQQL